ncbi:MAG: YhfC family intramembrane metalloprotease [Velocimicrobium sp.]
MSGENNILLQELCLLINVIISFGIPIAGVFIIRKKAGRIAKPFIIGMAAFLISQPLTRIPLLSIILPSQEWYIILQCHTYLYGIFLGLTAGIFEEFARLIFMKLVLKGRTRMADGLSFGLGHGGIEAMLFLGINSIAAMIMYPTGLADLSGTGSLMILVGGLERIFAITFHVGASLIILYGIREQKAVRYTLLAVFLHGLLDSMIVILPAAIGLGTVGLEIYAMILSALVIAFGIRLFMKKPELQAGT